MSKLEYLAKCKADLDGLEREYCAGLLTKGEYWRATQQLERCIRDPLGLVTFAGE